MGIITKRPPRHGSYREVDLESISYRMQYCEVHGWFDVTDDGSAWLAEHFSCEKELLTVEAVEYGNFVIIRVPAKKEPIPRIFEYYRKDTLVGTKGPAIGAECTLHLAMDAIDRIDREEK